MDNLDIILQKLHFERYVIPQLNTIKRTTYLNQFPYWDWNNGTLNHTLHPIFGCHCTMCQKIEENQFRWRIFCQELLYPVQD